MRKDKEYWVLEAFKLVFFALLPITIFILKCTSLIGQTGGTKFILGCSGYIVAMIVYLVIKKVVLRTYLQDLNGKIVNYTTQIETETDQSKIPFIEKALSKCLSIRAIFTIAPILIVGGLGLLIVKSIEQDFVKLYSVLGLIAVSYLFGTIVWLIQASKVKSKHRK